MDEKTFPEHSDPDEESTIEVDFNDQEFIKIARAAHERDMTFNDFCVMALTEAIKDTE